MTLLTDREAQVVTQRRDVASTTPYEVCFTDVKAWAAALEKHIARGLVEDNEVWFSVTSGVATLEQVEGKPAPGGHREVPYFAARYVEVAYTARGKLNKLSVYCGCSWQREAPSDEARRLRAAMVQECAEAVTTAVNAVSKVLGRHPQLEVNSGASLHLHNMDDGPWSAYPGTLIEMPPEVLCSVCGAALHFANERWRDEDGRYEITVLDGYRPGSRMPRYKLDHVHSPQDGAL